MAKVDKKHSKGRKDRDGRGPFKNGKAPNGKSKDKSRVRFEDDKQDDEKKISLKRKRQGEEAAQALRQKKTAAIRAANKPLADTKLASEQKAVMTKTSLTAKAQNTTVTSTRSSSSFRIIAGSYERILYGLDASPDGDKLEPLFIFPAHIGCIKCLAVGGRWLASGSTDEVIKLYDLSTRKEAGSLLQSEGSITSLAFHSNTHLLSSSSNGNVSIYRTSDFSLLSTLRSHKGSVHSLSVHPSGKIALTVGSDRAIRLWNLLTGRKANKTKIVDSKRPQDVGEIVAWNAKGTTFAIMATSWCKILDMELKTKWETRPPGEGILSLRHRFNCMAYVTIDEKEYVIIGCEDKAVRIYDNICIAVVSGHTSRVKAVAYHKTPAGHVLVSASSDGSIRVWDLKNILQAASGKSEEKLGEEGYLLAKYDTNGSRLTCLTIASDEVIPESEAVEMIGDGEAKAGDDDEDVDQSQDEDEEDSDSA